MQFNNEIIPLDKKSESDDDIQFTWGSNVLILYRSPNGTIFKKNGDKDDLCIKINGFNKDLQNLTIDDTGVLMTFYNG